MFELETETVKNLATIIETNVKSYLEAMGKEKVTNLYDMVLEQIEPPLFKAVMERYHYNQSKAAQALGLSRGTFRTRLIKYFGEQYCGRRESNMNEAETAD